MEQLCDLMTWHVGVSHHSRASGKPGAISRVIREGLTMPCSAIHWSACRLAPGWRRHGHLAETAAGHRQIQFHMRALETGGGFGELARSDLWLPAR